MLEEKAKEFVTLSGPYQVSPGVKRPWRSQLRMLSCMDMCAYSGRICPHDSVQRPKQASRLFDCAVWLRIAQPVHAANMQDSVNNKEDCRFLNDAYQMTNKVDQDRHT